MSAVQVFKVLRSCSVKNRSSASFPMQYLDDGMTRVASQDFGGTDEVRIGDTI